MLSRERELLLRSLHFRSLLPLFFLSQNGCVLLLLVPRLLLRDLLCALLLLFLSIGVRSKTNRFRCLCVRFRRSKFYVLYSQRSAPLNFYLKGAVFCCVDQCGHDIVLRGSYLIAHLCTPLLDERNPCLLCR